MAAGDHDMGQRWIVVRLLPTEDEQAFGAALSAKGWSPALQVRACAAFTIASAMRRLMPGDESLYRHAGLSRCFTWEERQAFSFGYEWGGRRCCRCGARGRVRETEVNDGVPIHWTCTGCGQFVCIDCALTIPETTPSPRKALGTPGSSPPELYEETWCSEACRTKK